MHCASADQSGGMMVMSVVENGPAAQAEIVAGDILDVDGISAHRSRKIARYFGGDSIGRTANVRLIRGGAIVTVRNDHRETAGRMSEVASDIGFADRLRVAVFHADNPLRRRGALQGCD